MTDSADPNPARFVLVGPRTAGNAGAAARALKNLGFSRLVLVAPRFSADDPQARRMAVDAADVLLGATVCPDLDAALEGARTVIGMSARVGRHRKPHWRLDEFAERLGRLTGSGEFAFVFGREDSGLTDLELDRCTHLVRLDASARYTSFNLAQSVLIVAYELRRIRADPPTEAADDAPAAHDEREAMYRHLERALLAIGYLHRDSVEPIMRRFRRLIGKAEATHEEVRLLRGLARQVLWTAGKAGLPVDETGDETGDEHR